MALELKLKVKANGEEAIKKAMKHGLIPRPPKHGKETK